MRKYTAVILAALLAVTIAGCSTKATVENPLYEIPAIQDTTIDCDNMNTKSSYSDCTHVGGRPSHYPY